MTDHSSRPKFTAPFSLDRDFTFPSIDEWSESAEKSLKGKPLEKLKRPLTEKVETRPLYSHGDEVPHPAPPGAFPFTRGAAPEKRSGWTACPLFTDPDPRDAAAHLAHEAAQGADSVWIRCAAEVRTAAPATALDGVLAHRTEDLATLIAGLDPCTAPVHLDGGNNGVATAALFVAAADRLGFPLEEMAGSFNLDPLGALAADGAAPYGLDRTYRLMADVAEWCLETAPLIRAISVSATPYQLAGADPAQELAFALATGVDYIRALESAGIDPGSTNRQMLFTLPIGRHLFAGAAKIRAFRTLWSFVLSECGVPKEECSTLIHAIVSERAFTRRDPWVNLLRTTVAAFAASLGGADILTTLPFDTRWGPAGELGRRLALNTHTILREESHLAHVVDPAGGSWYVEKLTSDLVAAAWDVFRAIEGRGGMRPFLAEGGVENLIESTAGRRKRAVATRREPVTGVSTWPNLQEEPLRNRPASPEEAALSPAGDREAAASLERLSGLLRKEPDGEEDLFETVIQAAAEGASSSDLAGALTSGSIRDDRPPLPRKFDATPFEDLRDASDRVLADTGTRPRVFLATLGTIPEHKPRATFARNLYEAGGIEALDAGELGSAAAAVEAYHSSGAFSACLCSSDPVYAAMAAEVAAALKSAGAKRIVLAGRPGDSEDAWRAAGIDAFIFLGCDIVRELHAQYEMEGVSS